MVPNIRIYFSPSNYISDSAIFNGLALLYKLKREVPSVLFTKIEVFVKGGAHVHKSKIDKQLNDKERVEASFANEETQKIL